MQKPTWKTSNCSGLASTSRMPSSQQKEKANQTGTPQKTRTSALKIEKTDSVNDVTRAMRGGAGMGGSGQAHNSVEVDGVGVTHSEGETGEEWEPMWVWGEEGSEEEWEEEWLEEEGWEEVDRVGMGI